MFVIFFSLLPPNGTDVQHLHQTSGIDEGCNVHARNIREGYRSVARRTSQVSLCCEYTI